MALRPNPVQWLGYAFGAGLPDELAEWVYRDTTGPTWVLRQLGRSLVQLAPLVLAVLVFVPGAFWIRGVAVVAATAMGLIFSLAYMTETTDHRLVKAGYPAGTGDSVRGHRGAAARTTATAQRNAQSAARRARRDARAARFS
jgi:hypothetical protein